MSLYRKLGVGILSGLLLLGAGCRVEQPPYVMTAPVAPTAQVLPALLRTHATDEETVTALLLAERQAAIDHDLALLAQLWAESGTIVDQRLSATADDDYRWQGRAAILDRYVVAVFPFALAPLATLPVEASISITADKATVQYGGDTWQLVKAEQRWWLTALTYGLPTAE